MGITRRFVFPALRLLVWGVIAVSLAVIAFRSAPETPPDPATPSAQLVEPQVAVATGDIVNTVTVTGQIVADPATTQKVTQRGTVTAVHAKPGDVVAAGAPLLEVTLTEPQEPLTKTDPETGEVTVTERRPKVTRETVTATTAGTVATFTALVDQEVAVGDDFATISPGTLSATGSLLADQQFRLLQIPTDATVTVTGGPAPFTCTGLRMGSAATTSGAPEDPAADPAATGGSASVTCAVPGDVTVFAGLAAQLEITAGSAEGALVLPVTAVLGRVEQGKVWVLGEDGEPEERPVTLGLTDGSQVQIVEGLAEGDEVLEFVPGQDVAPVEGGATGEVFVG
ncbi:secretion protein HlyD [Cellulosimicrobium sp. PMB13]|uniref:secretion protein HlyD n=1 Tax=Cellulosimicrobium sp. PMB13 TaxID=3120158 RepID=UPI003F4B4B81